MIILFTIIHIIVCLFLVIVVLLQSGKAADLAGAFGGMGSQTAFGPRGSATVLSKATTLAAAMFMVTSMSLAILATRSAGTSSTVLEREAGKLSKPAQQKQGPSPAQAPGGGPPSVTYTSDDGKIQQTVPLQLPPPPAPGQPKPGQPQPAQPAAPQQKK
ncbi:MAG: preprotein translocase subunit SecG [Bryobacterales bacterium]|nr:preprotein translocase subunit SecG [Bryobacterales bacterium]